MFATDNSENSATQRHDALTFGLLIAHAPASATTHSGISLAPNTASRFLRSMFQSVIAKK